MLVLSDFNHIIGMDFDNVLSYCVICLYRSSERAVVMETVHSAGAADVHGLPGAPHRAGGLLPEPHRHVLRQRPQYGESTSLSLGSLCLSPKWIHGCIY